MGTSLKGFGAFRRQLLIQLITRFGRKSFTFEEASTVQGFTRATFMKLYADGLLKKVSKSLPLRYSIVSAQNNERNSPSRPVESDNAILGIYENGRCLCSSVGQK
jgi:hypothetical protein